MTTASKLDRAMRDAEVATDRYVRAIDRVAELAEKLAEAQRKTAEMRAAYRAKWGRDA